MISTDSILIVGAGVFGLSTALALVERGYSGRITIVEGAPTIPNPHGSSVDVSRIVRADYACEPYAKLAAEGVKRWEQTEWGSHGRFTRTGLLLFASGASASQDYVRSSYANVARLYPAGSVLPLSTPAAVRAASPAYVGLANEVSEPRDPGAASSSSGPAVGGYVNWASGWAHAEDSIRYAKTLLDKSGRVEFVTGTPVVCLTTVPLTSGSPSSSGNNVKVTGVTLADGRTLQTDLVVLATGARTSALIDLRGRVDVTGQPLAFIRITDAEQEALVRGSGDGSGDSHGSALTPTILDVGTGIFIIPPRGNLLKVARHGFGWRNPTQVPSPLGASGSQMGAGAAQSTNDTVTISLAEDSLSIPPEAARAFRTALRRWLPASLASDSQEVPISERPFETTRICWYTDTPRGDFIVSHHPNYPGLFLATGGNGHAFKFLPVLGDKVVDAIERRLDPELANLWTLSLNVGGPDKTTDPVTWGGDGSRSGQRGLTIKEELAKGSNL